MAPLHILQPEDVLSTVTLSAVLAFSMVLLFRFFLRTIWGPYCLHRFYSKHERIPSLPFRPLVGQIPELRAGWSNSKNVSGVKGPQALWPVMATWQKKFGDVYVCCLGPAVRIFVSDPTLIRQVLITDNDSYQKSPLAKQNLELLGNGLVLSEGSFWARQRRMINPAFNITSIKKIMSVMEEATESTLRDWMGRIKKEHDEEGKGNTPVEFEVHEQMSLLALNIIGKAAFGAQLTSSGENNKSTAGKFHSSTEIYSTVSSILEITMRIFLSGRKMIPFYKYLPTAENLALKRGRKKIQTLGMCLIDARRNAQKQGEVGNDLLACMLSATDDETNERMTNQQLMDECMTFLLAGHETTAQLMTWTMYVLAIHPEWQERVRREVGEVLDGGRPPAWESLAALKWTTAVLHETLRLFPPVPIISRHSVKETFLGSMRVKRGTDITIPIGLLHYDKRLWGEDAYEFRPERFAEGVSAACTHSQAFLAFSTGPRNCIGAMFALTEARVMLSSIISRFSWTLSPAYCHCPSTTITLRPKHGLQLLIQPLRHVHDS